MDLYISLFELSYLAAIVLGYYKDYQKHPQYYAVAFAMWVCLLTGWLVIFIFLNSSLNISWLLGTEIVWLFWVLYRLKGM